jgi:hypothetical protein
MEGKESGRQGEREVKECGGEVEQQSQVRGGEKATDGRVNERRSDKQVDLEGKRPAKDTFANCLKDSGGDLLDRLTKQFGM